MGEFLVAGCDVDPVFSDALSKLRGTFQWGTWNEDNFTLTGIEIETLQDGGFHLRQQRFVDQLELMSLSQRLSRAGTDKLTPNELTQLRGVSGSANWLGRTKLVLIFVCVRLFSKHQQGWLIHVRQTNSFVCVDSTRTCQFEFLRFLWTI